MLVLDCQQQGADTGKGKNAQADEKAPNSEADDARQKPGKDDRGADRAEVGQPG